MHKSDSPPNNPKPISIACIWLWIEPCICETLLAYIRTGLMFAGTGLTFLKLFSDDLAMRIIGGLFIGVTYHSLVLDFIAIFGLRYLTVHYPKSSEEKTMKPVENIDFYSSFSAVYDLPVGSDE